MYSTGIRCLGLYMYFIHYNKGETRICFSKSFKLGSPSLSLFVLCAAVLFHFAKRDRNPSFEMDFIWITHDYQAALKVLTLKLLFYLWKLEIARSQLEPCMENTEVGEQVECVVLPKSLRRSDKPPGRYHEKDAKFLVFHKSRFFHPTFSVIAWFSDAQFMIHNSSSVEKDW